jgi:glyoxylase I family protein
LEENAVETTGLNHVILTISQVERSRTFYRDVLGFETHPLPEAPDSGFYFRAGNVSIFVFASRFPLGGDRFNEFRIGLDHLSFTAPSEQALHDLAERLRTAGSDSNGVERFAPTGNLYVAFRDPDNIQLEYWLP